MNRKETKKWVDDTLKKGYDLSDVNDLLKVKIEKGKITPEEKEKILIEFNKRFEEVDKTKLGFLERRRVKKNLSNLRKIIEAGSKEIERLTSEIKTLNKKEDKELNQLKEQMIEAITGDIEKNKAGLLNIFDIEDEKTGKPITKEILETYEIQEIEELLSDLLDALEKEI